MQQTEEKATALAAAERIAHLESEIAAKRAEICQLQIAARDQDKADDEHNVEETNTNDSNEPWSESPNRSLQLDELKVLWEKRSASLTRPQLEKGVSASAIHDAFRRPTSDDVPPDLFYTSSTDSDETRDAPPTSPSPRINLLEHLPNPFGSPRSVFEPVLGQSDVNEGTAEERDQKIQYLEAVIGSDAEIIRKMKDTIEKMIQEKKAVEPKKSSLCMIIGELESTIELQEKQTEILREECTRLQGVITDIRANGSSQEKVMECMKAEMVKLQFTYRMAEEEMGAKLVQRDMVIANLENSFKENVEESKRMITAVGVRNSALEDRIEDLKAENARLQVRSQMMEEEKRNCEESMKMEMQLLCIEKSHHEIF